MGELRKDPVTGQRAVIARERAGRPRDTSAAPRPGVCPFCEGREADTPAETAAMREEGSRPDGPGWQVRVIPNKFPAFEQPGSVELPQEAPYETVPARGFHEIIIEGTGHEKKFEELDERTACGVVEMFRQRILAFKRYAWIHSALIFKNHGKEAGATLTHPHSQLAAMPFVPKNILDEIQEGKNYFEAKKSCPACDTLTLELKGGARLIEQNQSFALFAPYAPRFGYETWIVPKRHESHFENLKKEETKNLASLLQSALGRLNRALNAPPFNFIVHSAPLQQEKLPYFHWHMEIFPRIAVPAGFEWGAGCSLLTVSPEQAASELKKA